MENLDIDTILSVLILLGVLGSILDRINERVLGKVPALSAIARALEDGKISEDEAKALISGLVKIVKGK